MVSPVFLAPGSPFTIFEKSGFTAFLQQFGKQNRPKAIVIFSAHFESETTTIAATDDVHVASLTGINMRRPVNGPFSLLTGFVKR
ncbi:MAG: dioxygenase extradiol-like protein [Paenibacillus sp.]|nr:dioxygenase extradiol-like protein [Paenibacillus sp.]